MPNELLIIAGVILFFSSLVQSMIGFAFNLIAIPLLIWSGFGLAEAVVLTSVPIFVQLVTNSWKLRDAVVWDDLKIPVLLRYITLPAGIWLLYFVNGQDTVIIKQFVGVVLLLILFADIFISFSVEKRLPYIWTIFAFGLSGLMLGMLGMGGPPVVLWLMAHDWSARRSRAFITTLFLMASPIQIALLYYKLDSSITDMFFWGIVATPIVIIAALIGSKIGDSFDKKKLRKMVMFFLFLTAILSIFSPYLRSSLS